MSKVLSMDMSSPEAMEMIQTFNKILYEVAEKNEKLIEENHQLREVIEQLGLAAPLNINDDNVKEFKDKKCAVGEQKMVVPAMQEFVWYQEWVDIQNSFSWRITKPLRWLKKLFTI